jgi:uncharacterized protein (TIGR03118 family)
VSRIRLSLVLTIAIAVVPLARSTAGAGGDPQTSAAANARHGAHGPITVLVTDLVANLPSVADRFGIVHTPKLVDHNLMNPWGIAESPASPFWLADNNAGVSTLYSVTATGAIAIVPRVFSIPSATDPLHPTGTPTGTVFNTAQASQGFKVVGVDANNNATTAPAVFLFATEDGTIVGWNPTVNPSGFQASQAGTYGIVAVDNSMNPTLAEGAVYKGLAIATDAGGHTFLYATNFRAGTVEVFDTSFKPAHLAAGAFTDRHLPHGYAPFNIAPIGGKLFVTYAKQDAAKHDDVARPGHGIVDVFDLSGRMLMRFTQHGRLNSPWGLVQAPASFGDFAGSILIGNFGDGRVHAFDSASGKFLGTIVNSRGEDILIDGLWSLTVGNGTSGGNTSTIYFSAGPNDETDGLFGSLTPVAPGTPCGMPCR